MYNNRKYIITIIFFTVTLGLGIGVYFGSGNSLPQLGNLSFIPSMDQPVDSESTEDVSDLGTVKLPILPGEKDVLSSLILYFFQAPVKELSKEGEDYRLVLDTENKKIPSFKIIINRIQISRLNVENPYERPLPATIDEIKEGTVVQVGANYDFIGRVWTVGGITIVSDE